MLDNCYIQDGVFSFMSGQKYNLDFLDFQIDLSCIMTIISFLLISLIYYILTITFIVDVLLDSKIEFKWSNIKHP